MTQKINASDECEKKEIKKRLLVFAFFANSQSQDNLSYVSFCDGIALFFAFARRKKQFYFDKMRNENMLRFVNMLILY